MSTHSLTTALTLYHSGTLSLPQAARLAGCTEEELVPILGKHGIPVRVGRPPHGRAGTQTAQPS